VSHCDEVMNESLSSPVSLEIENASLHGLNRAGEDDHVGYT